MPSLQQRDTFEAPRQKPLDDTEAFQGLRQACETSDISTAEAILEANRFGAGHLTRLLEKAVESHSPVVATLLQNVSISKNHHIVWLAVVSSNMDALRLMLATKPLPPLHPSEKMKPVHDAFMTAVSSHTTEAVDMLLAAGADINAGDGEALTLALEGHAYIEQGQQMAMHLIEKGIRIRDKHIDALALGNSNGPLTLLVANELKKAPRALNQRFPEKYRQLVRSLMNARASATYDADAIVSLFKVADDRLSEVQRLSMVIGELSSNSASYDRDPTPVAASVLVAAWNKSHFWGPVLRESIQQKCSKLLAWGLSRQPQTPVQIDALLNTHDPEGEVLSLLRAARSAAVLSEPLSRMVGNPRPPSTNRARL